MNNTDTDQDYPLPGMTVRPEFYGTERWWFLGNAWLGLLSYAIQDDGTRSAFIEETGIRLDHLVHRSPITQAIDKATGFEAECMAKFCDWVTVNLWGVEEEKKA